MTSVEKKEFKRHFPVVNRCFCCCCMKLESAIKVCTIIFALFNFFTILSYNRNLLGTIYNGCVLISLVLLLIGMHKKNLKKMKQFIYIYLIKIIITVIIIIIGNVLLFVNRSYLESIINDNGFGNFNVEVKVNGNTYEYNDVQSIATSIIICYLIGIIIGEALDIYYYIVTCSYIEQFEEELFNAERADQLESNPN